MTTAMTLTFAELEATPSLLLDLFRKSKDVRYIVESDDEQVTIYPQRRYSEEAVQIVREARAEYLALKASGDYSREQAKADFAKAWEDVQAQIAKYYAEND